MFGDVYVGSRGSVHGIPDTGRSLGRSVSIAVFAAVLLISAGTVYAASGANASWYPHRWDKKIAPIAAEVARLRGLDFVHPVAIHYLSAKAFEKKLGGSDSISESDRTAVRHEQEVFRALGFIDGKVDLLRAFDTSQSSGTLAYYDELEQDIVVRGTKLDVAHRVTIAHELTHVLQDQHFNLTKLHYQATHSDTGDPGAFKALVEGDAVRIENAYLRQLPESQQTQYLRENEAEGRRVRRETASVPFIVGVLGGAPYSLGESTVEVLKATEGNDGVNAALTGLTPSSSALVEAGLVEPAAVVDPPLLPADGVSVAAPESFGGFEMFLTLATRLAPGRALAAADLVTGGKAVTFRSGGVTCYRVVVDPTSEHGRMFLADAVRDWANGRGRTSVDAVGDFVGFTVCDPGTHARGPSAARFQAAVELLKIRMALTVGSAVNDHVDGDVARCVARLFVAVPAAEKALLADSAPTQAQQAQLRKVRSAAVVACRADSDAGLP